MRACWRGHTRRRRANRLAIPDTAASPFLTAPAALARLAERRLRRERVQIAGPARKTGPPSPFMRATLTEKFAAATGRTAEYGPAAGRRNSDGPSYSVRSFALACSFVCHCMFEGLSGPPRFRGTTWSTT